MGICDHCKKVVVIKCKEVKDLAKCRHRHLVDNGFYMPTIDYKKSPIIKNKKFEDYGREGNG